MKLINRWTLAADVPRRFREDHGNHLEWFHQDGRTYAEVLADLDALGPRPSPDDVQRIVRDEDYLHVGWCRECVGEILGPQDQWTAQMTDHFQEAHPQADELVEFGYFAEDSHVVRLCAKHLLLALQLINP